MTVIEYFHDAPIDNISTCLLLQPDRLIFVGDYDRMNECKKRYESFLDRRKLNTKIDLCGVDQDDIMQAVKKLTDIVTTGEEFVFDMAGGDETVIAAASIVYERYKNLYPISMQRTDSLTGEVEDTDGDGVVKQRADAWLTADELVKLYGGIITAASNPFGNYKAVDLAPVWDAVTQDASWWNKRVTALNEFEKHSGANKGGLDFTVNYNQLRSVIANLPEKRQKFDSLINDMSRCGIIKITSRANGNLCYSYKNDLYRRCVKKHGDILEIKTLFEAREQFKNGKPLFNDCLMGVTIDWDGKFNPPDTKNEIDVMLMHRLTPIFISCKNGDVEEEELYKLSTVAERFGGEHAIKLLVATDYQPYSEIEKRSLIQRAADMGILFEPNAADLDSDGWHKLFDNAIAKKD